jgi:hypothetical protein
MYTLQQDKCKWFTLTLDLHVLHTAIDTYMHDTGVDQYLSGYIWNGFVKALVSRQ